MDGCDVLVDLSLIVSDLLSEFLFDDCLIFILLFESLL